MDKDDLVMIFIIFIVGSIFFTVFISPLCHLDDKYTILESEDILSYDVNEEDIIITTKDGEIYYIEYEENEYVDFTVNSKLYIKLFQFDEAYWFWEKPTYSEKYYIDSVVKIPETIQLGES